MRSAWLADVAKARQVRNLSIIRLRRFKRYARLGTKYYGPPAPELRRSYVSPEVAELCEIVVATHYFLCSIDERRDAYISFAVIIFYALVY